MKSNLNSFPTTSPIISHGTLMCNGSLFGKQWSKKKKNVTVFASIRFKDKELKALLFHVLTCAHLQFPSFSILAKLHLLRQHHWLDLEQFTGYCLMHLCSVECGTSCFILLTSSYTLYLPIFEEKWCNINLGNLLTISQIPEWSALWKLLIILHAWLENGRPTLPFLGYISEAKCFYMFIVALQPICGRAEHCRVELSGSPLDCHFDNHKQICAQGIIWFACSPSNQTMFHFFPRTP